MKLKNRNPQKVEVKNNMKKTIKRSTSLALLALVVILTQAPMALAAANLNNDPQDRPTLRVTNYTSNPDCNQCWSSSANVAVDEIASFIIYYHNTGPDTASNLKAKISYSISGDGRTINVSGSVSADNAGISSGNAQVFLPSGSEATSLTHLTTIWRPNQTTSGSASLPSGQSGSEVLGGSGLNIGDIAPGWPTQGSVVVRFRVEGFDSPPPPPGGRPVATTLSASDMTRDSASLRGQVSPSGKLTSAWFEWGRSSSNLDRETGERFIDERASSESLSASITDLEPNTTYFYRAVALNFFGISRGEVRSFTTSGSRTQDVPAVSTFSATGIDRESARLRGEANPRGESTRVWFEWGRSSSNLNRETSDQSIGGGNSTIEFSSSISGLDFDTTYYYRAIARNSFGTVRGEIKILDTLGGIRIDRPTVRVLATTGITTSLANIRGEVDPNESRTDAWFEWGTNPNNLANRTGIVSVGSGSGFTNVSSFLSGLSPNTTYYYRTAAKNNAGTSFSAIENFRTNVIFTPSVPSAPAVITQVVRVVQGEATAPAEQAIKFTLEADKSEVSKKKIVYFVNYGNLTNGTLRDGVVELNLPDKLEFVDSDRQVNEVRDKTLVFKLGAIRSGDRGRIEVKTEGADLKGGDQVTVAASLSYLNGNNIKYVVSATDITAITKADLTKGGSTATILDAFKEFFTNPIFWLLITFLVLYLIYRFLTARRQPPIYPSAGGLHGTAYPPQPPAPMKKPSEQAGGPEMPMYPASPQAPLLPPRLPEGPPFG